MAHKTKILIADDHGLIRKGLKQLLDIKEQFEVLEADDGEQALQIIKTERPDISILDIEMPKMSGFEVARIVCQKEPNMSVVFLTMYSDETIFNKAMDIGVKGYVLKENTVTEIEKCIDTVSKGQFYLSPSISSFLDRRNKRAKSLSSDSFGLDSLTSTERMVLKALSNMKTNQEIADEMGVSIKTIQNHRNNICSKLELRGTHALLKFAVENSFLF